MGLALQDTILTVDHIPQHPGKVYARSRRNVGGGPAATAAVTIARLGGQALIAARIGADATGDIIRREFETEGVDTTWLRQFEESLSPCAVVLVDEAGERLVVAHADASMPADPGWLMEVCSANAVLCDLSWYEGALHCLKAARKSGVPTVLDADISRHPPEKVAEIVEAADHVIFSRPGLAQFSNKPSIAEGLEAVRHSRHAFLGVTDGANGLYWLEEKSLRNAPPPQVEVVDTTGAGDAFHGAFALALAHRRPLSEAISFSNSVAALKCSRPGGRAGLPDAASLAKFAPDLELDWIKIDK